MVRRALTGLAVLLALPGAASAHGGTGMPSATDSRVVVTAVAPAVPGLRAEVVGNDFQLRLRLPAGAAVTVNRSAGERPIRATGGTLTWREHRLRHPAPDGTLQIGFTLDGSPVVVDLLSRRGAAPSPWPAVLLAAALVLLGALRPRLVSVLAVAAFGVMLVGAAGGIMVGRGTTAAVVAAAVVALLALAIALGLAAVPARFRPLAAGGVAATALLFVMAQTPMLYRPFPVSAFGDTTARAVTALALALALGALAAVAASRPWRAFETA